MRIFSSFFMHYHHKKISNLPFVYVEIWQLQSLRDAKKNPKKPFLRWITLCDKNFQEVFNLIPKSKEDCKKLWEFSVSEVFLHIQKNHIILNAR